jgi:hypothetical protein
MDQKTTWGQLRRPIEEFRPNVRVASHPDRIGAPWATAAGHIRSDQEEGHAIDCG